VSGVGYFPDLLRPILILVDSRILLADIMYECRVFISVVTLELEATSVCQYCFHFIGPFVLTAKKFPHECLN